MRRSLLYIAPFDPTAGSSGSAVRARLVLRFLAERYETHVVHLQGRHDGGRDTSLEERLASRTAVPYSEAGYFLFSSSLYRAACEVLRRHSVDFVVAEFEKAGGYAWLLSRRFGRPFFYLSHNVEFLRSLDLARKTPLRLGLVPGLYFWERQACRHALATFAISEADARVFRAWAPDGRVSVLPLAFDEEIFHPFYEEEEERDPLVVLMVGNYRYAATREGARFVLDRVVPQVLAHHPQTIFRFTGPGLPAVRHPNVQVPGFVDDLPAEYRRASVVVAPITSGGGIKIKAVEALAMGRFLVATPKAVEGVGTGLAHTAVVPLEEFADRIVEALARRPGRSAVNWEAISREHGAQTQLRTMGERIAEVLARIKYI